MDTDRAGDSAHAPGVKKTFSTWADCYTGTSEALVAAGLARFDQFPGQPGMRKMRVTIFPDGTMPTGAPTGNHGARYLPGSKSIERATKTTYRVTVVIPDDEEEARLLVAKLVEEGWTLAEMRQAISDSRLVEFDQRMRVPPPPRLKLVGAKVPTSIHPFSPELLAVARAADAPVLRQAENAARAIFDLEFLPRLEKSKALMRGRSNQARHLRLVWSA